jgi:hypothetical protein
MTRPLLCVTGTLWKKLLSLRWPVKSLLVWNRWVTAGFKTAHYGPLAKSVFVYQISSLHFIVFTLGSSSFVIPTVALLSKSSVRPSVRPSSGIETHISWTFIICVFLMCACTSPLHLGKAVPLQAWNGPEGSRKLLGKCANDRGSARAEILTSALVKIQVFGDVTSHRLINGYRHFVGKYRLHLQN